MARSASWKRSRTSWRYARVLIPLVAGAGLGFGQQQAGQIVTQPATQTPLAVTIVNNCKSAESFVVTTVPAASWVYLTQPTSFSSESGSSTDYKFMLNPPGNISPGEYQTNLTVTCTSCAMSVPPCATSAKTFPIDMVIPKPEDNSGGGGGENPSGGGKPGGGTPPAGPTNAPGGTTPGGTGPGNTPGGTTPGNTPGANTPGGTTPGGTTPGNTPTSGGTQPTETIPGTPGGTTTGGTTPTMPGATTPTPAPSTPTPGSLPGLLGGLITALGAGMLLLGSGPAAAQTPSGVSEGVDPGTPVGTTPDTPGTPVGTTPGTPAIPVGATPGTPVTPPQTPVTPGTPVTPVGATPGTPAIPGTTPGTTPQTPGTTPGTPVGTTPGTTPDTPQTPGSWDATLQMPTQGSVASATPPTTSGPLSDGVVSQTPTPATPQTPGSWDASMQMPLGDVAAPVGPQAGVGPVFAAAFGAGEGYFNPATGETYQVPPGQQPPNGWVKLGPTPPQAGLPGAMVSYIPGKEPRLYVNPKTGETQWVDFPYQPPDGWIPLRPTLPPQQQPVAPPQAGPGQAGPGSEYFNPQTGETYVVPPGQQPPGGWVKMGPVPPQTSLPPGSTVTWIPGQEPHLFVDPATGAAQWVYYGENPPAGWKPATPTMSPKPVAAGGGAASGAGGKQQVLDGGDWRPNMKHPPLAQPNQPGGILNQPLGEDPPPAKPNYGPGGILNQPLGEDPPPAKPNYGPGGILNQPLGEDPPPAKPNYGPGGILNQPLGEDPPPAKPVTAPTGDQKVGTGHTFSRGTTQADLDKANQPVAPGSLPVTGTSTDGDGPDEVGDRWKKTNQGMKENQEGDGQWHVSAPPTSVFAPDDDAPKKAAAPLTPEEIARGQFIDQQIAQAKRDEDALRGQLQKADPNSEAAAALKKAADAAAERAKIWQEIKRDQSMLSKGLKDAIDTLQQTEDLLAQAIRDGEGPDLVDAIVAKLGQSTAKIPGLKQLGQAFMGLSDRPLEEYGRIAWLQRMMGEAEHVIELYRSPGGARAVQKYMDDEAESEFYGAIPGMMAGGAAGGAGATSGALEGGAPAAGEPSAKPAGEPGAEPGAAPGETAKGTPEPPSKPAATLSEPEEFLPDPPEPEAPASAKATPGGPVEVDPLPPGARGQQELRDGMPPGLKPTQNKIYAGSIDQMANDMANGKFDWGKIAPEDAIQIDENGVIRQGHHRLVAAQRAAQATGRPLMDAPNSIIPSEVESPVAGEPPIKPVQWVKGTGARQTRTWGGVGVQEGTKPVTPKIDRVNDPDQQAIRDMFPLDEP